MEDNSHTRHSIGKAGEDAACRYLESIGHTILERNFRSGHLEIDIISLDACGVHFVEVKTRRKSIQAPPQESVDRRKQNRIAAAAKRFLRSGKGMNMKDSEYLFDVIAVTYRGGEAEIEWFPQAYIPIYL